jgi:hypothetical protein
VGSDEQQILMDYMDNGGSVYIEGVNVGYDHSETDFWEYLGCQFLDIGAPNIVSQLMGVEGTFSAPNTFDFPFGTYADYNVDELAASSGSLYLTSQDGIGRGVYYDSGIYRTVTASPVLGAMQNGDGSNTRSSLMERYLRYLSYNSAPDIWAASELSFDIQYSDYPATYDYTIQNLGFDELNIDSIEVIGDNFSLQASPPYVLAVGEQIQIPVTFSASEIGYYWGTLTIDSSDPDETPWEADLIAGCLNPPEIAVSSEEIIVAIPDSIPAEQTISVENIGETELAYRLTILEIEQRNEGGPDEFGYKWKDSNEPEGPVYDWQDISDFAPNTPLFWDELSVVLALPFDVPFYGEFKDEIYINSNGFLSFAPHYGAINQAIPDSSIPNDFIAPFWDDLSGPGDHPGNNHYYYDEDNQRLIIQYTDWFFVAGEGSLTFQIHLYPNGDIYFYYHEMIGDLNAATVGIENNDGSDGLQIVHDEDYIQDELAIRISAAPFWVASDAVSSVLEAGQADDITFTFDPAGLDVGDYYANAVFTSNDPAQPELIVPITLLIGESAGNPKESIAMPNSHLGNNFPNPFNPTTAINFSLVKKTYVELTIYDVSGKLVKTLIRREVDAGYHSVVWNGDDEKGREVASGVYFYRIHAGEYESTRQMLLLR